MFAGIDRVGQQLGNYRLINHLGRGGFADVYLGRHLRLNTKAAIKILNTHLTKEDMGSFQQEAQTIAGLVHPHIVRILDFDVQQEVPFLVMDYASSGSLRRLHPKGQLLPLTTIVSYVRQIADALQCAHDRKLIHRDVKPENMLVGRQHEVLLSDFGIATIAHNTSSQSVEAMAGTVPYMAPEQIEGKPRIASDQYALAVTVYEWLCGERPFKGTATEIAMQHALTPPSPLHKKLPTLAPEVEEVVMKALAKDPKERFASVQAFATALEQASQTTQSQIDIQQFDQQADQIALPARRRDVTRLLVGLGLGIVAASGTGVAAYELGPKLPQALSTAGTNIEHQLQDAFNKGLEQGAENVRKEFVTALENLEGFTLDGAVSAAKLTRVAYDVFVSPIVNFGATITGDFLSAMLSAFKTARGWLAGANQDNSTLIAIQKVLEAWVAQVSAMPKPLDAITQTDLDAAQAYLRALQRKLEDEKSKLNNPQATPTPAVTPTQKPAN